jgi:hypothetical protein
MQKFELQTFGHESNHNLIYEYNHKTSLRCTIADFNFYKTVFADTMNDRIHIIALCIKINDFIS